VLDAIALAHQIAQVWAVETGDVFVGIAQLELGENVVTHMTGRTRRKRGNGAIGKLSAKAA
jgi:hypothetical protein